MQGGYTGRILRVNLTTKRVTIEILNEVYARQFVGGSGLAAKLIFHELLPEVNPLSPANKLVFLTGPLTGTAAPCCGRYTVTSKSPLTGFLAEAGSGGHWGPELKFAGYDGIIVEGKSKNAVYLWVCEGNIEIKDADCIWGTTTLETEAILRKDLKEKKAKIACIGPAGENLVKIACIINDGGRAAGRCGLGAVMGSKKLKAIAVRGTKEVNLADEKSFTDIAKEATRAIIRNPRTISLRRYGTATGMEAMDHAGDIPVKNWTVGGWPEGAKSLSGEQMAKTILKTPYACFRCPIGCGRTIEIKTGQYSGISGHGPEYETCAAFGTMLLNDNLEAVAKANDLCTRYGLDTISCGSVIAWAAECYDRSILTKAETGGLDLSWGNYDTFVKLVELIGKREGIGNLLGEGVKIASEKVGRSSSTFALHVKGLELPMHDPRAYHSLALGYATSNRGACHLAACSHWIEGGSVIPGLDIELKSDRFHSEGKAEMVMKMQNLMSVADSLVVCKFALVRGYELTHIAKLLSAATGFKIDIEKLLRTGERIFNLKRVYNVRLGADRKHDTLPSRILSEPTIKGGSKGHTPDLEQMIGEYYKLRGWTRNGKPTYRKLKALDLAEALC